ncbi:MAG: TAXI family TRAP transporter solute-binding subunit [Anaerolineae bacterium]
MADFSDGEGSISQRSDIEAVGVVGTRFIHLVERSNGGPPSTWRRLGVSTEGGSSWTVARLLLQALGLTDTIELVPVGQPEDSAARLLTRDLDALVVMVEQGHPGLMQLLRGAGLRLAAVEAFRGESEALRYPFLRQAVIPAGIYPGQTEDLPTLSTQVVIATRLPQDTDGIGESGPGYVPGVFTRLPQRLPFETAGRLSRALASAESVDPLLPASPGLKPETPATEPRVYAEPASALLNVLAVAFLIGMLVLYLRPLPPDPALTARSEPSEA